MTSIGLLLIKSLKVIRSSCTIKAAIKTKQDGDGYQPGIAVITYRLRDIDDADRSERGSAG